MRETLFRGKRKDTGAWVCGDLLNACVIRDTGIAVSTVNMSCECEVECRGFRVVPDTVGEYTGLDDKNGVKIFEGDIVRYTDEWYCVKMVPVVWGGEYYPAFDLAVELRDCANSLVELLLDSDAMVEVIGNIHDNPELAIKE
ncbi:MAG: YopX family protein [Spirochaetaceae bacterium]|jgi:uncharacterized phage protein (TIGR01671 family)|nr:YopX family protein [Spirochaetaceae bacterium]